ncbi:MAG: adenosylcobinamide amidohydrolase [Nitrososphaeria archaeon]
MSYTVNEFDLGGSFFSISSGLHPLGPAKINKIVSFIVPENYSNPEPLREINNIIKVGRSALLFITAAKNHIFFKNKDHIYFVSLGIKSTGKHAGHTINIAVFVKEPLSFNALVELVKVITEAKCGALMEFGLKITGTVTDAVAVGTLTLVKKATFAGTATPLGSEIGRNVYRSVNELLKKEFG